MKKFLFFILVLSFCLSGYSMESRMSNLDYVDAWKQIAVQQMIDFKIPASITLAQGILESGSGNSMLAQKGNNHFGIKCHGWEGEKIYFDDDAKGECFRVYDNAELSYVDHSEFLTGKSRYNGLFDLELTDYKGWAKGLRSAGYATNPKYPHLLIDIIERLDLNELDKLGVPTVERKLQPIAKTSTSSTRTISVHKNKVKYVVAKNGDTFYKISKEVGLSLWQLYKYNDFSTNKEFLIEGDVIYIQPKKIRAKERKAKFTVSKYNTSLKDISQKEAIKMKRLLRKNDGFDSNEELPVGTEVRLR
jgi:LysM repeat protein